MSCAGDQGRALYLDGAKPPCIRTNLTVPDGNWQAEIPLPNGGSTKKIKLTDIETQNLYSLGDLFGGKGNPVSYSFRPESACYAICQKQLGPDCTFFTYDGITKNTCEPLSCSCVCYCAPCLPASLVC